jgi:hypothetical protein
MTDETNPFESLLGMVDKTFKLGASTQKLNLVMTIVEMSLKYNKTPKEIVKLIKETMRELEKEKFES